MPDDRISDHDDVKRYKDIRPWRDGDPIPEKIVENTTRIADTHPDKNEKDLSAKHVVSTSEVTPKQENAIYYVKDPYNKERREKRARLRPELEPKFRTNSRDEERTEAEKGEHDGKKVSEDEKKTLLTFDPKE